MNSNVSSTQLHRSGDAFFKEADVISLVESDDENAARPKRGAGPSPAPDLEEDGPSKRSRTGGMDGPGAVASTSGGGGSAAGPTAPILLLLVGLPGSGKSTFARRLPSSAWLVVNQDTIHDGHPGSRKQCLTAAREGLREGRHVCIDRTNMTVEQRGDFLLLASEVWL